MADKLIPSVSGRIDTKGPRKHISVLTGRVVILPMVNILFQIAQQNRGHGVTSIFRHLGALGLFSLAFLGSTPVPTFSGPDILTAILAARHRDPWYEYAGAATAGSVLGAYFTFRIARKAGAAYLNRKFGEGRVSNLLRLFEKWGAGALAVSAFIPIPFPTSIFFAAAGVTNYRADKYLGIVTVCRAFRFTIIAVVADHYGRHFVRILRHPAQYWGWLLLFAALIFGMVAGGIMINRRLATPRAV